MLNITSLRYMETLLEKGKIIKMIPTIDPYVNWGAFAASTASVILIPDSVPIVAAMATAAQYISIGTLFFNPQTSPFLFISKNVTTPHKNMNAIEEFIRGNLTGIKEDDLTNGIQVNKYLFRYVQEKEIDRLAALGYKAFSGYSSYTLEDRRNFYTKWFSKNEKSFILIHDTIANDAIGYMCVLPMEDYKTNAHYTGSVSQFKMDAELIVPTGQKTNLFYLQGIFIEEDHRTRDLLPHISDILHCLLAGHIDDPNKIILYAEQFSTPGGNILRNMGFYTDHKKSYDDHDFYELHFCMHRGKAKNESIHTLEKARKTKNRILDRMV